MNMNLVVFGGNITRQPETRIVGDTSVTEFGIASNEKWRDAQGNDKEKVCFVDVSMWGKRGEAVARYLNKGDPILITGKLTQDVWEDKQTGEKRSKIKITAESFEFVGGGQRSDNRPTDAEGDQSRQVPQRGAPQRPQRPAQRGPQAGGNPNMKITGREEPFDKETKYREADIPF